MKSTIRFLNMLALIHLFALLGFVAWLWQSGRLDLNRIDAVREAFALTIADEAIASEDATRAFELAALEGEEEARRTNPPLSSAEKIGSGSILREQERQTNQRLNDEKRILKAELDRAMATMKQLRSDLALRESAFEATRQAEVSARTDEQFKQIVQMYESMMPRQAKQMLVGLMRDGETMKAVRYLNAMSERPRSKILREFKSEEEVRLATDLLEGLRTLGQEAESNEESDDAKPVASVHITDSRRVLA